MTADNVVRPEKWLRDGVIALKQQIDAIGSVSVDVPGLEVRVSAHAPEVAVEAPSSVEDPARSYHIDGMTSPTNDQVNDKVTAVEARIDAKLANMDARLTVIADRLASAPSKLTIWGAAGTALGLALAAIAFGGDQFGSGAESARYVNERLIQAQKDTDAKFDAVLKRLDGLAEDVRATQQRPAADQKPPHP